MTDTASIGRLLFVLGPVVVLAALISAGLIIVLSPWLKAHALARPNARSSHREATPQGGGVAVVVATFAAAWGAAAFASTRSTGETSQLLALTAAAAARGGRRR